jgi:hypothetical protein
MRSASGDWIRTEFLKHGVDYQTADLTTSEAFLELLPKINQGIETIELLDDPVQRGQLVALERRKGISGRDALSHPGRS